MDRMIVRVFAPMVDGEVMFAKNYDRAEGERIADEWRMAGYRVETEIQ